MQTTGRLFLLALVTATGSPIALAEETPDAQRYDLAVTLGESRLSVSASIRFAGRPPATLALDLVPEMAAVAAEAGGRALSFTRDGDVLSIDLAGVAASEGGFSVLVRAEGSPREEQRSRGFLRSVVRADVAHIRSQVAWYPRRRDDPAVHRITIDAPAAWQVRTAGDFAPPSVAGARAVWTFETAAPIDRAGLAAGPWKLVTAGTFDALVAAGDEAATPALLAATRRAIEFHAKDLGPMSRPRFALVEMPPEFGQGSGYSECGYILVGPGAFSAGADWVPAFLAHEAAHQWWGNDGLFADFANESLAEFSALRCVRALDGPEAATRMRRAAIDRVAKSAAAGKEVALADIREWGGGMDPETYRVHAYEKAMMLLVQAEQAAGADAMTKLLRAFLAQARTRRVGWKDLRAALVAAGPAARAVVEQAERPGIPSLRDTHETKKSGSGFVVTGRLVQSGTGKPVPMSVLVAALCGDRRIDTLVKMDAAEVPFTLRTPAEPDAVVIDPDGYVLAAREAAGGISDPKKTLETAIGVANDQSQADPRRLEETIAALRALLKSGVVAGGEEAVCHTGIGHCLFRLGRLDEAVTEYETALRLGAGGPFHRGWVNLRLGNIDDLRGRRKDALAHYEAVISSKGSSANAVARAKRHTESPYRGYREDG